MESTLKAEVMGELLAYVGHKKGGPPLSSEEEGSFSALLEPVADLVVVLHEQQQPQELLLDVLQNSGWHPCRVL